MANQLTDEQEASLANMVEHIVRGRYVKHRLHLI